MPHVRVFEGQVIKEAIPEGAYMLLRFKGSTQTVRVKKAEYLQKVVRVERPKRDRN